MHTHTHTNTHTNTHIKHTYTRAQLLGDQTKAVSVMMSAVETDSSNAVLYLQLLDLHTSTFPPDLAGAEMLFQRVSLCSSLSEDVKESFAQRRQQLVEEFGGELSV